MNRASWVLASTFFLAALSLLVFRFSLESSQWMDETYSVVMAHHSVDHIVALSAQDAHPPGYYLTLKLWLKGWRILGKEPGVFQARCFNLIPWLSILFTTAWMLKRLDLTPWIPLALATFSASAGLAGLAKELRGYSLTASALFLAGCLLTLEMTAEPQDPKRRWPWWGYAASMSLALWTHLQSLLFWGLFVGLWLAYRKKSRSSLSPGLWAHLVPLLLFLPWLPVIFRQRQFMASVDTTWMTPATLQNFLSVFVYWLPLGRISSSTEPLAWGWLAWGILSFAVPLGLFLVALFMPSPPRLGKTFPLSLGLGIPIAFTALCWILTRLEVAPLFHAPRYPLLGVAFWSLGLLSLTQGAVQRLRWPIWAGWILMAPWLCGSLLASWHTTRGETHGGLVTSLDSLKSYLPEDEPLYVMPSELIPFYRRSLASFEVHRIEDWPCASSSPAASVLNLNRWTDLDRPRDLVAKHLILGSLASDQVRWASYPEPHGDHTVYRLEGQRSAVLEGLCARGLSNIGPQLPPTALSGALPRDQDPADHWSYLEVGSDLDLYRWGSGEQVTIRFDRKIPAGSYLLHLKGARTTQPHSRIDLGLELVGAEKPPPRNLEAGPFHLKIPVTVNHTLRPPSLRVRHPVWSPEGTGSRQLSFLFYSAWIEPSTSSTAWRSVI
jgi:hypothetical protein